MELEKIILSEVMKTHKDTCEIHLLQWVDLEILGKDGGVYMEDHMCILVIQ